MKYIPFYLCKIILNIQELLISSTCLCPLYSTSIQKKTTHRFNHYWGDKRQMNDICKPVIEYPEKNLLHQFRRTLYITLIFLSLCYFIGSFSGRFIILFDV